MEMFQGHCEFRDLELPVVDLRLYY